VVPGVASGAVVAVTSGASVDVAFGSGVVVTMMEESGVGVVMGVGIAAPEPDTTRYTRKTPMHRSTPARNGTRGFTDDFFGEGVLSCSTSFSSWVQSHPIRSPTDDGQRSKNSYRYSK
jgi:hypothetical protein